MGYYSDTAIALTKTGVEALKNKLAETEANTAQEVRRLLEDAKYHHIDPATGAEVWRWPSVKWYQGEPVYYPEINFIENLLGDLDEDDFRMTRIGEDYEDTEVRGEFIENPFDLELVREISLKRPVSANSKIIHAKKTQVTA